MNKPYLLFKNRKSPYWYAQIRLSDGSLSTNKSTGKESKSEAEKVVMEWVVAGAVLKRVSRKGKSEIRTSLDTLSILNQLKIHDFSDSDINQIISILKERNYIKSAIRVETKVARNTMDYLLEF